MHTHRIGTLSIDLPRLLDELERIAHFEFSEAYSSYLCGGPWKSCMLWSIGGEVGTGFVTNYDYDKPPARTCYADQLPYLWDIIERSFNLDFLNFARLAIISNSVIIPHKDLLELTDVPPPRRNVHRLHLPLITNENCYFSEDNIVYRMKFGEAWFFDSTRMHSAASFSEQDRVHLILDFPEVGDISQFVRFDVQPADHIPGDSIYPRSELSGMEREALLSLASVVDIDNYRDIFGIVIRKHFRRDGGENFIWDTMTKIATSSGKRDVEAKIREMYRYFLVQRSS